MSESSSSDRGKTVSIGSFEKVTTAESMKDIIEQGKQHCDMLFNFKSVIPSLIQVKGDSENKIELYTKNLDLLDPQVQKMRNLLSYVDVLTNSVVGYFQKNVSSLTGSGPFTLDAGQLSDIKEALDIVLTLDYLKTWQAGLNNDFSMYRRAIQHVKKDYNSKDDESLRTFLINPNNINKGVKKALQDNAKDFEKVLLPVIKHCLAEYEKDSNQAQDLRVAIFSIFLIDHKFAEKDFISLFRKHIKFTKTLKLVKDCPKSTLYKNLPFNANSYLKAATNFRDNSDQAAASESSSCHIL